MNYNNHEYKAADAGRQTAEIFPAIDRDRMPQLNLDNVSCHCDCARLNHYQHHGEDDMSMSPFEGKKFVGDINLDLMTDTYAETRALLPTADSTPVDGEQGVEDHLMDVGDLGFTPAGTTIYLALARHASVPGTNSYMFTSMQSFAPGMSDSMLVELSSTANPSLAPSPVLSIPSRSSTSLVMFTDHAFEFDQAMHTMPTELNLSPLMLPRAMDISLSALSDPLQDFQDGDFITFDIWLRRGANSGEGTKGGSTYAGVKGIF